MQGYMDEFFPGPSQRLIHYAVITAVAYLAMSCSSQRTSPPTPAVAQPRIEENTSSRDSSDQKNGKNSDKNEDEDEENDSEPKNSKSGSKSADKGTSEAGSPTLPGTVPPPPTTPPSLDPALVTAACTAPTIRGDAVKLRQFLNDPDARSTITPAQKQQALASIMGVSDADLQAALNMQCRPGVT